MAQKVSQLPEISLPELEDLLYFVEDPAGIPLPKKVSVQRLLGQMLPATCQGRLTTESGVPISTADRASQSTIFFTPYLGNRVALHDGTRWRLYSFTERSLALSGLTANKNYDVFLFDNAGTLALELSAAWTNDTTRADALVLQDGIFVKSGATTRRYIGTIRATGATTTEDVGTPASGTTAKRFVWNYYNRVPRQVRATEADQTWLYSAAAWRSANADNTNRIEFVQGFNEHLVEATVVGLSVANVATDSAFNGVGVDTTTANSANPLNFAQSNATVYHVMIAHYRGQPGIGYHFLQWIEFASTGGFTFFGDGFRGITGTIWG